MRLQTGLGWTSIMLLFVAFVSWITYGLIGAEIDEQGLLHEPFALIPIGWLCFFAGALSGTCYSVLRLYHHFYRKS